MTKKKRSKKRFKRGALPFLVGLGTLFFYFVADFEPDPCRSTISCLFPVFGIASMLIGLISLGKGEKNTDDKRSKRGRSKKK